MGRSASLHPALRRLSGAVLLAGAASLAVAAEVPKHQVEAPHYGDGLFHF